MKITAIGLLILLSSLAPAQGKKKMADHCTPDGGSGSVRCGGASYSACIELHPDICESEDVLPSCCAASPLSPDQTAVACQCCRQHKQQITIPYDAY